MSAARHPLSFDPIAEARRNWDRAGWTEATTGMAFVTSIVRAHQLLLARIDEALSPFGLTFARFEVLMLLRFTRAGRLPLSKIGQRLQVHPTSVTNAVDRLEADGLVERRRHPTDGRTTLAAITRRGRQRVDRAADALNAVFVDPGVPGAAAEQVIAALTDLRRNAGDFVQRMSVGGQQ